METIIIFGIITIAVIILSWRTLFKINTHGFYRFFSWECIAWLIANNYKLWFDDAFCIRQIFSWILLLLGLYVVLAGVMRFKKAGKHGVKRDDKTLYKFENTTELIDTGIYKYIRHPLYFSLILLTWGIFLKDTTYVLLFVSLLSTAFLFLTAIFDERECVKYFGEKYTAYMKRTKMFIPFII